MEPNSKTVWHEFRHRSPWSLVGVSTYADVLRLELDGAKHDGLKAPDHPPSSRMIELYVEKRELYVETHRNKRITHHTVLDRAADCRGGLAMLSVLDSCQPRQEILAGTFNPEVFTASLAPIIEFYRTGRQRIDSVYADARSFFGEATFPTQGLRTTLSEVFARIAGDMSVPAIHRLETAFGGGKTHTLIACTHIAFKGRELADVTSGLIDPDLLPDPNSVAVAGVAGDEIPVHKPRGKDLIPYTLWGEIAYQIGGEALYGEVESEAASFAAPGKPFLDKVLGGRKALIMLDELAQYAARLEAARPDGASQLSAFLMTLHGYARNNPGIAIVLTLASATDAFAKQTEKLAQLISQVRGQEVSQDEALSLGDQAVRGVTSVVAREAVQVIPVHGTEIASVLAKRLFVSIDRKAAELTADEYMQMYRRNSESLPDEASTEGFRDRMVASYPFHPTLVDFLNHKLAVAENFQGTRGVLRVLSLAVRTLWQKRQHVPMIHACHLDLRSDRVVNEILGRTGSSDLMFVLNADIGSVDTGSLEGGRSNAEIADERNRHPEGHPMYEYTWKTVFLHSLVGRSEGISSNIFGLTEAEALFATSFPGLTPPQVRMALEEIGNSAYYLRFDQGKYFAGEEPTINSVLARIRRSVRTEEVRELINATARKLFGDRVGSFHVEHDVSAPEHVPDGKDRLVLAIVSPTADSIDVEAIITTVGPNRPRMQQNTVILLVPDTVAVKGESEQTLLEPERPTRALEVRQHLETTARAVRAMRLLSADPQRYGVNPARLDDPDFKRRKSEREHALHVNAAQVYSRFFYPSAQGGKILSRHIRTAGGEGGVPFGEEIRNALIEAGELLTERHTAQSDLMNMQQLVFRSGDVISVRTLLSNFLNLRAWPMLEEKRVLEQILRAGVQKGTWCVFRMEDQGSDRLAEIFHEGREVPMSVDLLQGDYSLVSVQGARQRRWLDATPGIDVRSAVRDAVSRMGAAYVCDVIKAVVEEAGDVPEQQVLDEVRDMIRQGLACGYEGSPDQAEPPELMHRTNAVLYVPDPDHVVILPSVVRERGWDQETRPVFDLSGSDAVEKLKALVHRIGSIYNRGATTTISELAIDDILLPGGGVLGVRLYNATPQTMKALDEFFQVLGLIIQRADVRDGLIRIDNPDEACPLMREFQQVRRES